MTTRKLRVLVIAEAANPEWVSVPLVGWSLANELRNVVDVHLVTQIRNCSAIERQGLIESKDFTSIDSEKLANPLYKISKLLRGGTGKGWTTSTAINAFAYYYFEHLVWQRFGKAIRNGDFDIVHRITPLSPTIPSLMARKCHRAGVAFVLGPLNGGVPWPKEFDAERREEKEWLSYVRNAYKLLPGYHSTLHSAAALIIGSHHTLAQIPDKYHKKCIYLPENGIDPKRFSLEVGIKTKGPLRVCFVGRLVPYKGPDMLLEAAAPLIRENRLKLEIFGDGPLMGKLRMMVEQEGLANGVNLYGWVEHSALQEHLRNSQVFAFPSIREFGGGVVLEAMALGLVPIVVDYAGPAELVSSGTGFKIPLGRREDIVTAFRQILRALAEEPTKLESMGQAARSRVFDLFTWEVKARQVCEIYKWMLTPGKEKPVFFQTHQANEFKEMTLKCFL